MLQRTDAADAIDPLMRPFFERSGLAALRLGGRALLPIVQGGMGVGLSAHRLAGSVAAMGAVGTISSVDLRRHHPDLMALTGHLRVGPEAKAAINAANLEALAREVHAARAVRTHWLSNYLAAEPRLQANAHVKPRCILAFDCLTQCGLGALPFGTRIATVPALLERLLTPGVALGTPAAA